jgi:hypothetical protein
VLIAILARFSHTTIRHSPPRQPGVELELVFDALDGIVLNLIA